VTNASASSGPVIGLGINACHPPASVILPPLQALLANLVISVQKVPNPGNQRFCFRTSIGNIGSILAISLFIVRPDVSPCKWVG
jgi:hypothetical protein